MRFRKLSFRGFSNPKNAGLFEAPPAMLKAVGDWAVSVYAGHVLAIVTETITQMRDQESQLEGFIRDLQRVRQEVQRYRTQDLPFGKSVSWKVPTISGHLRAGKLSLTVGTDALGLRRYEGGDLRKGPQGRDEPAYQLGSGERRVTYGRPQAKGYVLEKLEIVIDSKIGRVQNAIELVREGRGEQKDDASLVDAVMLQREAAKYTTKAKEYAGKAKAKFPVDLTGWKYIQPNSPVVREINERRRKHNERIDKAIAEAEKRGWDEAEIGTYGEVWVPLAEARAAKKPMLGPKDAGEAIAEDGWKEINVALDFKGHAYRGGQWTTAKRLLEVDVEVRRPTNVQHFHNGIRSIREVVRHEMQHVGQDLLAVMQKIPEDAGLPSRRIRTPGVDPLGNPTSPGRSRTRAPHHEQDAEFYTNLSDDIDYFVRVLRRVPKPYWDRAARTFLGIGEDWETLDREIKERYGKGIPQFQTRMHDIQMSSPQKHRKAVAEFYKELRRRGYNLT